MWGPICFSTSVHPRSTQQHVVGWDVWLVFEGNSRGVVITGTRIGDNTQAYLKCTRRDQLGDGRVSGLLFE